MMLLVVSSHLSGEVVEDLAGDVALEAPHGFDLREAFLASALDVAASPRIGRQADHHDPPERGIGVAITTSVQPVALLLSGRRIERGDATEVGEGALAPQPLGVVAGGDQERSGGLGANAGEADQIGRGFGDQRAQHGVELGDLGVDVAHSPGQ